MNRRLSFSLTSQILIVLLLVLSKAHAITSLTDDFNSETAQLNYAGFANWDVTSGGVDTVASGSFGVTCSGGSGICVDLDGTNSGAGTLSTKNSFDIGTYTLSFDLSGNQRISDPDSVIVTLGDYMEQFDLASDAPWQTITRTVNVTSMMNGTLSFAHAGGDNFGILLDNVSVGVVPIPAAAWLFGSALLGLAGYSRRKANA